MRTSHYSMKHNDRAETGLRLLSYLNLRQLTDKERAVFRMGWDGIYQMCDYDVFKTTGHLYAFYIPRMLAPDNREPMRRIRRRSRRFQHALDSRPLKEDIAHAHSLYNLLNSYGEASLN